MGNLTISIIELLLLFSSIGYWNTKLISTLALAYGIPLMGYNGWRVQGLGVQWGSVRPGGIEMKLKSIPLLLLLPVLMLVLAGCDKGSRRDEPRRASLPPTDVELNSAMKWELLALANNRDAWFLASDITTEALEGLYGSWSVICRNETSLADYKELVYEYVRPLVLGMLEVLLEDVQEADRYYNVESWISPWAYVEQTWKFGDKIVLGPERQLYVLESGAWRYHDC